MAARSQLQFSNVAGEAQVTIFPSRSGCIVAFLLFWFTIWTGVGLMVIGVSVLGLTNPAPPTARTGGFDWGVLFIPLGWLFGVVLVGSILLWLWRGREVLTVAGGELRIQSLGGLLKSDDIYALAELYSLRVRNNSDPANQGRHRRDGGAILFDYGFETVAVANDLPEGEAHRVVDFLHQHRVDWPQR